MDNVICRTQNITKIFPGVVALEDVSLDIHAGKVHAVVGENGAGKSTLMNILSGVFQADEGEVFFGGAPCKFKEPKDAQHAGVAMIHQELSLSPFLSVAENVYSGRLIKSRLGLVDRRSMNRACKEYLESLDVDYIDPQSIVEDLSVSEMQLVEICKAISLNAKMLIMDEPTSSLTNKEVELLFKVVNTLRGAGVAILYISHKLEEIMEIADEVTVLRDGKLIETRNIEDIDMQTMINLMVGREFDKTERDFIDDYETREPIMEVENLCDVEGKVKDVSFTLYKGEVLGLTGLIGAGRSELLQTIFGVNRKKSGTIKINGKQVEINNARQAMDIGIALIPEGRKIQGLFLELSVADNMIVTQLSEVRGALNLISKKQIKEKCSVYKDKLRIKTPSLDQIIVNLSGGNQQKTILARWLMNQPKIIFMDEPTHGIDIGAKNEIYRIIQELSATGVSVVLLTSELPEALANCDRIMVMHHGQLRGVMQNKDADQVKIMERALER